MTTNDRLTNLEEIAKGMKQLIDTQTSLLEVINEMNQTVDKLVAAQEPFSLGKAWRETKEMLDDAAMESN